MASVNKVTQSVSIFYCGSVYGLGVFNVKIIDVVLDIRSILFGISIEIVIKNGKQIIKQYWKYYGEKIR